MESALCTLGMGALRQLPFVGFCGTLELLDHVSDELGGTVSRHPQDVSGDILSQLLTEVRMEGWPENAIAVHASFDNILIYIDLQNTAWMPTEARWHSRPEREVVR